MTQIGLDHFRIGDHLGRKTLRDDLSLIEDDQAIADRHQKRQNMFNQQDSDAALAQFEDELFMCSISSGVRLEAGSSSSRTRGDMASALAIIRIFRKKIGKVAVGELCKV